MKLEILENSKNYTCQVVKIKNLRKHSNADKLMTTTIHGNNVICGLDTNLEELHLYFPLESQLSLEFCEKNDLIRRKDELDNTTGGMFTESRRVKAVKLRGEKSEGFIIPISFLTGLIDKITVDSLKEGDEFNIINGVNICKKYVIPKRQFNSGNTTKKGKVPQRFNKVVDNQLRFHVDTSQLKKNIHKLELADIVSIHYKKHGTSWWVSNVLGKRKLTWLEKLSKIFRVTVKDTEYQIFYGNRRVVKNKQEEEKQHFYSYDLWKDVKDRVKEFIPKGYTLYGEAIGFTKDGAYIQHGYDYSCGINDMKVYIYRITITNEDGVVIDLDCNQILEFCNKYDLLYADTFKYYGTVANLLSILRDKYNKKEGSDWREDLLELLMLEYTEKKCYMCNNNVPEEGIIIRKQSLFEYEAYKLKSFAFFENETKLLDKGVTNIEDNE